MADQTRFTKIDRRNFLSAVSTAPLVLHPMRASRSPRAAQQQAASEDITAIDFSRSFLYYVPKSEPIWVRMQVECRCQITDRTSRRSDEYVLSVRTQTGLRTNPPSDVLDPGYDFWMMFSRSHVFIKRVHTSSYNRNPTRVEADQFVTSGWHLEENPARPLRSAAEIRTALQAWRPIVARSEFASADRSLTYTIDYPVKWADASAEKDSFRVETGPVVLLDPERAKVGRTPESDDFQWAYLDYHSFDRVRCFLEQPTSIFSGATYRASPATPRRNPPLTAEQVDQIEARLYSGWEPPVPAERLRKLLQTDHYSAVSHRPVQTSLFALER